MPQMKQVLLILFIFGFLHHLCTCVELGTAIKAVTVVKTVFTFTINAKNSYNESKNLMEFVENLDPLERHLKKIEGKIDNLHNSIMELKKEFDNLKLDSHLKHFNSHIKYPTIHVFNAVQRFFERPSNHSKNHLKIQCHQHPPISILEVLNDIFNEISLADLAKLYNYESRPFNELIKTVDKVVEALTLSQATCSGMQELEDAKYDFRKLRQSLNKILEQINRSKDIVHKSYFNYTKTLVKEYLVKNVERIKTKYPRLFLDHAEGNVEVGLDIFALLQAKYNYGPLYIVGVSRYYSWFFKDDMTHYGNLLEDHSYTAQHDGISVIVFQAPSLCDTYNDPHDNLIYSLTNKSAEGNSLSGMYKSACDEEFTCAYLPLKMLGTTNIYDIFISNGGVCRVFCNYVQTIIIKRFTSDYTYKPIELRTLFYWDPLRDKTGVFRVKPFSIPFTPVKYLKTEILFVEDILRLPEMEFIEKLCDTKSLKNELTANVDGQKYTNFKAGYNYIFYGKIICDNGNPIGENAIVSLIEVDEFSSDDVVMQINVDNNGDFIVKVDSNYNDFPSSTLELKLKFKNCCGYYDQFSGNLKNGTTIEYTLSEEGVKFI